MPDDVNRSSPAELDFDVLAFDQEQVVGAGLLRAATQGIGLSLGDQAAAASCNAVEVTTDRAWGEVEVGIALEVLDEPRYRMSRFALR